jgi:4-hydroxybutyryl-CoA dehydratase/vinylacetyl-CoA-Delta-isomerase
MLKDGKKYIDEIRKLSPNVYMFDERIKDLAKFGMTRLALEGIAMSYDLARDPRYRHLMTARSDLTNDDVNVFTHVNSSVDDLKNRVKVARLMCQRTGVCTGRCPGWDCINALWFTTFEMDRKLKTNYHKRFRSFLKYVQENDLTCAGALTDPKGNRSLRAARQADPDLYVRVVEKRKDGIVVRGAKTMIAGGACAHEIMVQPGTGLSVHEKEYAVAFAVPIDTEGIVQVVDRQSCDERKNQDGFDKGNTKCGSLESLMIFDDVLVPNERIFMCGEYEYAVEAITKFVLLHRMVLAGCLAGCGDVLTGASSLLADYNGLNRQMTDKLSEMVYYSESMYSSALGAATEGAATPSGAYFPDTLLANVSKLNLYWMPYEIQKLADEIAGGIASCMPSEKDLRSKTTGRYVEKYLKGTYDSRTENRMRAIRLIENLTSGAGRMSALCMHGGGSPAAAKLVVRSLLDLELKRRFAKNLAGIE